MRALVPWLRLGVETLEALTVALGMVLAAALFLRALLTRQIADFNAICLTLARCLFHGYKWVPATIIVFGIPVPFPSRPRCSRGAMSVAPPGRCYWVGISITYFHCFHQMVKRL